MPSQRCGVATRCEAWRPSRSSDHEHRLAELPRHRRGVLLGEAVAELGDARSEDSARCRAPAPRRHGGLHEVRAAFGLQPHRRRDDVEVGRAAARRCADRPTARRASATPARRSRRSARARDRSARPGRTHEALRRRRRRAACPMALRSSQARASQRARRRRRDAASARRAPRHRARRRRSRRRAASACTPRCRPRWPAPAGRWPDRASAPAGWRRVAMASQRCVRYSPARRRSSRRALTIVHSANAVLSISKRNGPPVMPSG